MTKDEKMLIQRRMSLWRSAWNPAVFLKCGMLAVYIWGLWYVWLHQDRISGLADGTELISPAMELLLTHSVEAYILAGGMLLLFFLLYPLDRSMIKDRLTGIGFVNHAGVAPELVSKRRDQVQSNVIIWEFRNQGIPLPDWENNRAALEAALDITVIKVAYWHGKTRIRLYAVPARTELPEQLDWQERFLSQKDFVLSLGESLLGPVTVDLAHIPHVLLGGSTGSGKSVLLKLLLMQALHKGAQIYIADFKGGVDFPPVWHEKCKLCFDPNDLVELLTMLTDELQRRKTLLKESGHPNLDEYNKAAGEPLKRIVFACDEVAEILDKSGLSKEEKALVTQIEIRLSVIARQGRAFGIHLILATQRPDASILSGQIRNNLDCRICGRADNVLSQIILDNTDAADQIPKDARGRFMLHDGTIFQAYWFDERHL